jgi:diguanylate cyclase (GGDEF)-like protein/PAS domain S-box-containing protein
MTFDIDWQRLLEHLHDGVYFTDLERRITYWNRSAEQITGYQAAEVIGSRCADNILVHVDMEGVSLCLGRCPMAAAMTDGQHRAAEVYLKHKSGHRVPVSVRVSPLLDSHGEIIGGAELFSDISSQHVLRRRMQELEELALVDSLTGLSSRNHLEAELEARIEESHRYGIPFGVLFLDVDHFKAFNDRYGHDVGDRALKVVAATFRACARPFDLFGRWGGEEFIGIIRHIDAAGLRAMAERIRRLVEGSMISLPGELEKVTVSVGATLFRAGDDLSHLVRRADQLMYRSKQAGRNCVSCDF